MWDSVAARPLASATVQLVAIDAQSLSRSSRSDTLGRFTFPDIPVGRYAIGFLHPLLDSLGIEAPMRNVVVGPEGADVWLGIPSAKQLRATICKLNPTVSGVLLGFAREAQTGAPVPRLGITGEWIEYTFVRGTATRHLKQVTVTTAPNGWFALCGIPSQGSVVLTSSATGDSSARVELGIPESGFARRDLYVATGSFETTHYTVRGLVVANGKPVHEAEIQIAGSGRTRTDARGTWQLDHVRAGTRMMEIRALGYYPVRRAIDALEEASPIDVELFTMRATLDTIRVTASRLTAAMQEFERRRRTLGVGRFLTRDNIARLHPVSSANLFMNFPGVEVLGNGFDAVIVLKGAFTDVNHGDRCNPDLYVDGVYIPPQKDTTDTLHAFDLDLLMNPDDIAGVEVYREPFVPPQFSRGLRGCGSIVVWRMPPSALDIHTSRKRRLLVGAALVSGGILLGSATRRMVR